MKFSKNHKISLDKFINLSLYNKQFGYYMKKNPFGKKGDFITAPNISRLFSEMVAIWAICFWQSLGSPKKFNLIELGAGNGEMMKILIDSFKRFPIFFNSCNIVIHEKSQNLIKVQKSKILEKNVNWLSDLKNLENIPSIFIANEFFDSIPIKQFFKKKNLWFERFVDLTNTKKNYFFYKKTDIKKIEKKINIKISNKQQIIEYSPTGIKYLNNIAKIIKKNNGGMLIIDYGYNEVKMQDTLQAIYKHEYSNVLENIGKSDITHNINFHLFKKIIKKNEKLSIKFTSQKNFLINLGIKQRAEIISRNKKFTEKTDIYYRLKRLIDEKEMGDLFKVMLIKKSSNSFKVGF